MEDISKLKEYPLSTKEIMKLLNNKVKIVIYPDIIKYKSIEDLIGKHNSLILLYLTTEQFGHYTCLFKNKDGIQFFDSYGYFPDDQLKFVPSRLSPKMYGYHKILLYLLSQTNNKIFYNQYRLQSLNKKIATCGFWCVYRLRNKELTENEFYNIFKNEKDPDLLVVNLVINNLNIK